jgi:hypothetical protein
LNGKAETNIIREERKGSGKMNDRKPDCGNGRWMQLAKITSIEDSKFPLQKFVNLPCL